MVQPIQPLGPSGPFPQQQNRQERRQLLEIEFETAVLGIFVAVSGQNHTPQQQQLSKIKNALASGEQNSSQLVSALNQLIGEINEQITPGKPKFPHFVDDPEGNQPLSLTHFAITLEKCLQALGEKSVLPWKQEENLFQELKNAITEIQKKNPAQGLNRINHVIDEMNQILEGESHIPTLPKRE
jgi:hypothetical protein